MIYIWISLKLKLAKMDLLLGLLSLVRWFLWRWADRLLGKLLWLEKSHFLGKFLPLEESKRKPWEPKDKGLLVWFFLKIIAEMLKSWINKLSKESLSTLQIISITLWKLFLESRFLMVWLLNNRLDIYLSLLKYHN